MERRLERRLAERLERAVRQLQQPEQLFPSVLRRVRVYVYRVLTSLAGVAALRTKNHRVCSALHTHSNPVNVVSNLLLC